MKRLAALCLLLCSLPCLITMARIEVSSPSADFGLIREADGPASIRIFVRNVDSIPLSILKVVPTCGCTATDFYEEVFAPGDSAWIDLTFTPYLHPGRFEKAVRIFPSTGEKVRVNVVGVVDAAEETIQQMFPIDGGMLLLSEKQFMTLIPLNEIQRSFYADAYNSNDFPIWVDVENDNEALDWNVSPNPVPPKEKATIALYVNPYKEKRQGVAEYKVKLYTSPRPDDVMNTNPVELKIITDNHAAP